MRKLNIYIIRLLLFFYLTSSYLSAIHIHSSVQHSHPDCKVCILVKNLNSSDTPNSTTEIAECNNCYEFLSFQESIIDRILLKGFNSQAPPKLS
jgi:hypothetical protein